MSDVFISYSHEDTEFVRDLVKPLEAEGFSVWWDHTIPPGKTWDEVIARGIREASRAARIEPITPVGAVYASQEFAALAEAVGLTEFVCQYVGVTPMAKSYGEFPTYQVRRAQDQV